MSTKRSEILTTARKLFSEQGFNSTGVDTIMAEAGISKRTLYKYFPTKDDLIDTVVQGYVSDVKGAFDGIEAAGDARAQIVTLFRTLLGALGSPGMQGCLTVRAMGEFGGTGLPVESSCQTFKRWEREWFDGKARELGAPDPAQLGLRLLVIYEGMFAYTQVMRTSPPTEIVTWVEEILDAIEA